MRAKEPRFAVAATPYCESTILMSKDGCSLTKNLYAELSELLSQGFYRDNFDQIINRISSEASGSDKPLALFVVSQVLGALASQWDVEQGVESRLATRQRELLEPPISAFFDAAAAQSISPEQEVSLLNDILRALYKWGAEQ